MNTLIQKLLNMVDVKVKQNMQSYKLKYPTNVLTDKVLFCFAFKKALNYVHCFF